MNGNVPDSLSEINHLINDVEDRLVAKSDELHDAKEEAERSLQQLLEVQSKLEQEILSHCDTCRGKDALERKLAEAKEENELVLLQLHQVQEELELIFLQNKDEQNKLRAEAKQENELVLLQLRQAQEELGLISLQHKDEQKKLRKTQQELEYYFLEYHNLNAQLNRQAEKLAWLRSQRELLIRMVRMQGRRLREMIALDARVAIPMLRLQSMSWWRKITLG